MSDDDRTVDADGSTMGELRRLAAEARDGRVESVPDDVTVDADGSTMGELRRLAAEARSEQAAPDDGTVDADSEALDELYRYAAEAREPVSPGAAVVEADRTSTGPDDDSVAQAGPEADASAERAVAVWPAPTVDDEHTQSRERGADADERSRPAGSAWTPPPRMVMPTEPEKRPEVHHGPWRAIALVLAAVVIVLIVIVAVVLVTGDDDPTDDPSDTVPVTGIVEGPGGDDG